MQVSSITIRSDHAYKCTDAILENQHKDGDARDDSQPGSNRYMRNRAIK